MAACMQMPCASISSRSADSYLTHAWQTMKLHADMVADWELRHVHAEPGAQTPVQLGSQLL